MLFRREFIQSRQNTSSAALIAVIEICAKGLFDPQITPVRSSGPTGQAQITQNQTGYCGTSLRRKLYMQKVNLKLIFRP